MALSVYSLSAAVFLDEIEKPDPQNDAPDLCIHGRCGKAEGAREQEAAVFVSGTEGSAVPYRAKAFIQRPGGKIPMANAGALDPWKSDNRSCRILYHASFRRRLFGSCGGAGRILAASVFVGKRIDEQKLQIGK